MQIYGWIVFWLLILGMLANVADSDQKGRIRVFVLVTNIFIALYVLLTLIK